MASQLLYTTAIPSSTVQCHASNLLLLPDKTLLCAWFGGSQEGLPDICIWLSRKTHGSDAWSTPVKISSVHERSCQNPVLFRAPETGHLWLYHTSQELGNQDTADILVRTSEDDGVSWSEPRNLLPGKQGIFVRQPVMVLKDGTWVLPVFHCVSTPGHRWIGNEDISAVLYSKDGGSTWSENVVPDSTGSVHMNIVSPSSITSEYVAFYRSRWADNIYRSTSSDGLKWSAPKATSLPNPNSGICATRLPSGKLVIVFNRSAAEAGMDQREGLYDDITPENDKRPNQTANSGGKRAIWGTPRKTLTVAISDDEGISWKEKVLEDGDGFCMTNNSTEKTNKELSYPSVYAEHEEQGCAVHIAFTFHRQYIKYARIDSIEKWISSDL